MKQKSILIFEDDIDLALQWSELFTLENYSVTYTSNYKEALELCKKKKYDLILCDIFIFDNNQLSGFGGITLIQRLRRGIMELDWTETVPIIIVSGVSNANEKLERYKEKYNASAVFEKPVEEDKLLFIVSKILGKKTKNINSDSE